MATHAFSTKFKWDGNYVGSLTSINGIEVAVDSVEVTTHDSPDKYKEYIPGNIDGGEVSLEGLFDYTDTDGQQALLASANSREIKEGEIIFPSATGTTWTFDGFATNVKMGDAGLDGAIPFSATIKVTGKPVLTVATSTGMSALAISDDAVLYPDFAIGTYTYTATVLTGVSSVTVTPTAANHTITVTANGASQTVTSGQASSAITLGSAGSLTSIVIVVKETNKAPKTYTINVARA